MKKFKLIKLLLSTACVTTILSSTLLSVSANTSNLVVDDDTYATDESELSTQEHNNIYEDFGFENTAFEYEDSDVNPYGDSNTKLYTYSELLMSDNVSNDGTNSIYDFDKSEYNSIISDNNLTESKKSYDNYLSTDSTPVDLLNSNKDEYIAKLGLEYSESRDCYNFYFYITDEHSNIVMQPTCISSIPADDNYIEGYQIRGLLSITSGNFDDDEMEEIAVYAPNNSNNEYPMVYIYDLNVTADKELTKVLSVENIQKQVIYIKDYNKRITNPKIDDEKHRPVVDLVAGDLTGDGIDEFILTSSYSLLIDKYYSNATSKMVPVTTVFSYDKNTDNLVDKISVENTWADDDDIKYSSYGSSTIGDFDGDNKNELLIAGYDMEGDDENDDDTDIEEDTVNIQMVKYLEESNSYELNPYCGDKNTKSHGISIEIDENLADGTDEDDVLSPVAMIAVDLFNQNEGCEVFIGGITYKYNISNNNYEIVTTCSGIQSLKNEQYYGDSTHNTSKIWIESMVVGNFENSSDFSEQIVFTLGRKRQNIHDYRHDVVVIHKKSEDDNKIYASMCEVNCEDSSEYNQNVDLTAIDIDNDSVTLEYKDRSYYFSQPEVFAVLQAAPYFTDLTPLLSAYSRMGGVGLGQSTTNQQSHSSSLGITLSVMAGFEAGFAPFGIEAIKTKTKFTISNTLGSTINISNSETYSIKYSSESSKDRVILGFIPYVKYSYDMFIPEFNMPTEEQYEQKCEELKNNETELLNYKMQITNAINDGYEFGECAKNITTDYYVSVPKEFRNTLISVDSYDKVAEQYGYDKIKGNIIDNTVGDPRTYNHNSTGLKDFTGGVNNDSKNGFVTVPTDGGTITQSIQSSESASSGLFWTSKVSAYSEVTIASMCAGVGAELSAQMTLNSTSTNTTTFEGTVAGIPIQAEGYGYSFMFQFGRWKDVINDQECYVLGFLTDKVVSPPSNANYLTLFESSDTTATLMWQNQSIKAPTYYEVFMADGNANLDSEEDFYKPKDENGEYITIDPENTSYTFTGLKPETTYYIKFRAVENKFSYSPYTNVVKFTTQRTPGENTPQVEQLYDYYTYPQYDACFNAVVTPVSNENDVSYQWQKLTIDNGVMSWKNIPFENESKLILKNVNMEDNNTYYRCKVHEDVNVYTNTVGLYVKEGFSDITMNLTNSYGTTSQKYSYEEEVEKYTEEQVNATYENEKYKVLKHPLTNQYILQDKYNYYIIDFNSDTEKLISDTISKNSQDVKLTSKNDFKTLKINYVYRYSFGSLANRELMLYGDINFVEDNRIIYVAGRPVEVSGVYTEDDKTLYYAFEEFQGEQVMTFYYQEYSNIPIYEPVTRDIISYEDNFNNECNYKLQEVKSKKIYYETVKRDVTVESDEMEINIDINAITSNEKVIPDGKVDVSIYNNQGDRVEMLSYDIKESSGSSNKNTLKCKWTPEESGQYNVVAKYYDDSSLTQSYSNEITYQAFDITSPDDNQIFKICEVENVSEVNINNEVSLDVFTKVNNVTVENGNKIVANNVSREELTDSKVSFEVKLSNGESAEGKYTIKDNVFKATEYGQFLVEVTYGENIISSAVITVEPSDKELNDLICKNIYEI